MRKTTDSRSAADGKPGAMPDGKHLLETLKRGVSGQVLPMLATLQEAAHKDISAQIQGEHSASLQDDLVNLGILRNHALMYERRWQQALAQAFEGWPRPAQPVASHDAFELVSETELWSQLVGQPVIDTLDRRFEQILTTIDSRLSSLSAAMGGQGRPLNPVAPRVLVEGLLQVFPANECNPGLRSLMLRHFEQLAGENLGGVYHWLNKELSEAGVPMSRASDYATLIASSNHVALDHDVARKEVWSSDNAVPQVKPTWRGANTSGRVVAAPRDPLDAVRGNALRSSVRALRASQQVNDGQHRRILRDEEFLVVLSLLQADGAVESPAPGEGIGAMLGRQLTQGASRLGIDPDSARISDPQQDAVDIVGLLFDRLRDTYALDAEASRLMERLAYPWLHLALTEPYLFDQTDTPAHQILSTLLELWDANPSQIEPDAELHALADATALQVIDDYHGEADVLERVLDALTGELEVRNTRNEISLRRTWQSILGQERLHAARAAADVLLARAFDSRELLQTVADFLSAQWRQALIQVWLRDGPESGRYRGVVDVGEAMVRLDAHAAEGHGRVLAEGLIAIERPLRDCHVAYGMDEASANQLIAAMIAELSRPDEPRRQRSFTPLADGEDFPSLDTAPAADALHLQPGLRLIAREGGQMQAFRLAWISPVSGRHLLVNRQGLRQHLLTQEKLVAQVRDGTLTLRPAQAPLEHAIAVLLRDLGVPA